MTCDQEIQKWATEGLQPAGQGVWQTLAKPVGSSETSSVLQNSFGLCGGGMRAVRLTMALVVRPDLGHIVQGLPGRS